jgi:hypothetical protein
MRSAVKRALRMLGERSPRLPMGVGTIVSLPRGGAELTVFAPIHLKKTVLKRDVTLAFEGDDNILNYDVSNIFIYNVDRSKG